MKLFAGNAVKARSLFWYYMAKLNKIKKANGEIVQQQEIWERNPNHVKNFGFWIRYDSRSNTVNMYKEYRDLTLNGAVQKMYADLASRHRARKSSIQILRTAQLENKECKRPNTQQFHDSKLKFRLLHRIPRPSAQQYRKLFRRKSPTLFF
jgi:large subunit ribosomal protein L18Ae